MNPSSSVIRVSVSHSGDGKISLKRLAEAFGLYDIIPALPGDLNPELKSAHFSYDLTKHRWLLIAETSNGCLLLANPSGSKSSLLLEMTLDLDLKLSELPLVGKSIPATEGIQALRIVYGEKDFNESEIGWLKSDLQALYQALQSGTTGWDIGFLSLQGGLLLAADLVIGGTRIPVMAQMPKAAADPKPKALGADYAAGGGVSEAAPAQGGGMWVTVGKTFGPLQLQRVGIVFADGTIIFALDASIALGPLSMSVQGLGIGTNLPPSRPVFSLTGLGFSYVNPPVEISGALARIQPPPAGVRFQFDGMLVIKAQSFCLAAIGSYAEMTDGRPSLFLFGQLTAPLGGPPAFFVTGLMAGFGFNRKLAIPEQGEVADFPLLQLGSPSRGGPLSDKSKSVLAQLEGSAPPGHVTKAWITPKAGEYWLAAGVQFTSFKLVSTKALLVAEFGQELTFALLGLSTLQLPLPETQLPAYAYVEMMLRVVIRPMQGCFAATAILSRNSYLIAPECHLTGGFAFYLWFGPSDHAGQFVVTLGGYHPAFSVPAHFPQVPRLGINWVVSNEVAIRGGAYFALTGSCAMAGCSLEVLFHTGDLRAWFTAKADFLLSWHPFFYTADIVVSIGVSYRIDLWFCHKTIEVSAHAALTMWGPPTGGVVRVHLPLISFEIAFGAARTGATHVPLNWDGFCALLPASTSAPKSVAGSLALTARDTAQQTAPQVCTIAITGGLFATNDDHVWLVRAKDFTFQTRSTIPVSKLVFNDKETAVSEKGISIRPMNRTGVTSIHKVTIRHGDQIHDAAAWSVQELRQPVPMSLWGAPPIPFSQIPTLPKTTAEDVSERSVGFSVTAPTPRLAESPIALSAEELAHIRQGIDRRPFPNSPQSEIPSPQHIDATESLRMVNGGPAQQRREALAKELAGLFALCNEDLARLAETAGHLFSDSPMMIPS